MLTNLWQQAGNMLVRWPRTLILFHRRPDGDALAAAAAMGRIIHQLGRHATIMMQEELPARYAFLNQVCPFHTWMPEHSPTLDEEFSGILILDTCSWNQLEGYADFLKISKSPRIVVDHHATNDDVCQPKRDLQIIDPSASSVALLIHEWAGQMNWPIDLPAAEALLTGIGTDTGWFRFPNSDGRTLQAAAKLIDQGVRPDVLYTRLYSAYSPARLRLQGEMLNTVRFELGGKLALAELTPEMFARADAQPADAEELVNELMNVGSVVVASLLSLQDDGTVRINLRSKSPEVAGVDIDVSAIANALGGGGHRRAAGARLKQSLDQARNQVIRGVESAWP